VFVMSPGAPRRTRPTFWEILVQGQPERCQGLLAGLVLGSGSSARLFLAHSAGIHTPLGERILDLVHPNAVVCHVIADGPGRTLLRSVAKKLESLQLRLEDERKIASAGFDYEFQAYAKRYGDEIRAALAGLPKGLHREGEPPKETLDKGARGIEAYSPVHDYEFKGSGRITGPLDLVLEARDALVAHPLVKVEDVTLEMA
jgi:hypothetical protein